MAYPTVSGPYGLVPVKLLSGVPYVGTVRHYSIASDYGTAIFYGDAVKLVTGGTVERDTFDAAMTPIGVFMGVSYTDPNTGQKTFRQNYIASTAASDIEAYVCDATDVLFKVAVVSSGTTIGDLAITDIGANVAGVDNTGDSTSGNSRCAISDTSATTATLPFRIVDLVQETKNSSGGFTEAYVKWNAGHQFDNTTGV
jgi:hypothetical protein|tara:strand:+ start:50 stop:643 length:594 start_codon:yes stop_codon:yes gene_type:complete